ncbi:hypothetical protein FIBSPDRAFT_960610 [Athelia psychrophila]|uniref:Uncharacterized protein n=1 Tax=Athelia psychrophila TaxID=1759441 RepID=A0A166C5V6_9AGAM|nr:hypothetical protein FIBSPDRAFT_960610 [Fibularhizoctonia sp. CBS 109695]
MSWEDIRKPGKHGLILVILALRWWGVASSASDEWKKAVDDVSSAVFCMTDGGLMAVDSTEAVRSNGQGLTNSSKRKADVYAVSKGDSGPRKKQLLSSETDAANILADGVVRVRVPSQRKQGLY